LDFGPHYRLQQDRGRLAHALNMCDTTLRRTLRALPLLLATVLLALLLFAGAGRGDTVSDLERRTAPVRQDLVRWEVTHFLDKWWSRLATVVLRQDSSEEAKTKARATFFGLGPRIEGAGRALDQALALSADERARAVEDIAMELQSLEDERKDAQPLVEEAIEGAITAALNDLGVIGRLGPFRWPPVDFTFEQRALVLVRSPRDKVRRLDDRLLRADVDLLTQQRLEDEVEADVAGVSALVVRVGGIATYPAQVSPSLSLHETLILASHEWTHHWLIFRPLGQRWWEGGELTSINETFADIVGEEVGDLALARLTGEVFERPPWKAPVLEPAKGEGPNAFSFQRYMRDTRMRLDDLLSEGRVAGAEAWLEERRLGLVANGQNVRKLNTAFFAFHGTYAADPRGGSVNPIEGQLRMLRAAAGSLAKFANQVSGITKVGQLETMARAAG